MIISKLVMTDFLPFKGVTEIDLSPVPGRPVVVVFAHNESGKTSILNGLRWALYGRAYKHSTREIGTHDLLNREAKEEGKHEFSVVVEFRVADDEYRLVRHAKPRNLIDIPKSSSDYEISVALSRNGLALSADQLEHEINQVAPEQISRFFLFDGELLKQYETLLVQGSDQGRTIKEAIERVLGLPALLRAREDLKQLERSAIREHDKDAKQEEGLATQESRLQELLDRADRQDEATSTYRKKIAEQDDEIAALESELAGTEHALKSQGRLDQARTALAENKQATGTAAEEVREGRAELWEDVLARTIEPLAGDIANRVASLMSIVQRRDSLNAQAKRLQAHLESGKCATCGQQVEDQSKKEVRKKIESCFNEIRSLNVNPERMNDLYARQSQLSQIRPNGAVKRVRDAERRLHASRLKVIKSEETINSLEEELEGLDTDQMKVKRAQLKSIESERQRNIDAASLAEEKSSSLQREAGSLRKIIDRQSLSGRAGKSRLRRELFGQLLRLVEASIDTLRSQLKAEVERRASEAFKRMTAQPHYDRLRINDSFGLTIVDDQGRDIELRSAGAEQVVALSLIEGLHKTGMGSGGVVMDTPFGRLDPIHRSNIITYLASSAPQVVMLVHEGELSRQQVVDEMAERVARTYELDRVRVFATEIQRISLGLEA